MSYGWTKLTYACTTPVFAGFEEGTRVWDRGILQPRQRWTLPIGVILHAPLLPSVLC
ncbi:hypothetical protein VKT23_013679 [Stygiomarasmius scandens]|uniref:Uncharacterized protein n=1 Tax=Marasmiellus scandens TaxID=2682957 RepID=A0ABR1J798_9AGAR